MDTYITPPQQLRYFFQTQTSLSDYLDNQRGPGIGLGGHRNKYARSGKGLFDIIGKLFGGKVKNNQQLLHALKVYKARGGKIRKGDGIFDFLGGLFG